MHEPSGELPRCIPDLVAACTAAAFDLIILETVGIGQHDGRVAVVEHGLGGARGRSAFPDPSRRPHETRALLERDVRGGVVRRVVGDPEVGGRKRGVERAERFTEPVGLVARGDDHSEVRRHRRLSCQPMPDVEAHITGTVWKIECEVGQAVDEGDTLIILESMKMEMPVEAEDPGTVKQIMCKEGQSVSEGDTLVVLE